MAKKKIKKQILKGVVMGAIYLLEKNGIHSIDDLLGALRKVAKRNNDIVVMEKDENGNLKKV